MIIHYLKVALRNLLKYKTHNLISIVGLAVGLFCFCLCFYISRFVIDVDKCFSNYEQIAEIFLRSDRGNYSGVPFRLLDRVKQQHWQEVEGFTLLSYSQQKEFNLRGKDERLIPYELDYMEVDSLYQRIFTPTILSGSWERAANEPNSIVLTEAVALRMFPDIHQAIGKSFLLNARQHTGTPVTYTVRAVIANLPENTSMNFMRKIDMLTLNDEDGGVNYYDADITGYYLYALLKEGYTPEQLNQSMADRNFTIHMFGEEIPVVTDAIGSGKQSELMGMFIGVITSIVAFLILLVASLNFFHFQTGSFLNRNKEFGIRRVLGNGVVGLFCMQFIQIVIVIFLATLLSGSLIELTAPFLQISLFRFSIQMDMKELLQHLMQYMVGMCLITALIAAGISLYIHHNRVQSNLFAYGKTNGKKRLRNTLLGIQFFISWLFVAMTIALYLQAEKTSSSMFDTLTQQEKKEIIRVALNYNFLKPAERATLIERFKQHAGVADVLMSDCQFISTRMSGLFETSEKKHSQTVRTMGVSANLPSFLKLNMEGRPAETYHEIVVGRNLADKYTESILGKTYYDYTGRALTVVGIIDNLNNYVYSDGYGKADYGNVYFLTDETTQVDYCYLKCHPGKVDEVSEWVDEILRETFPVSIEPDFATLLEDIEEVQALENKLKNIVLFFSLVSLSITLLGVYSAITLDTERKQKEVAIRKVNGAGIKEIIRLFARLYVKLLVGSALFAFPLIFLILHVWKEMYTVFFNDGFLYWGSVILIITSVTALTIIFRILKIARINPALIMKNE